MGQKTTARVASDNGCCHRNHCDEERCYNGCLCFVCWGATFKGRTVNGTWSLQMQFHINCLESLCSERQNNFCLFWRGSMSMSGWTTPQSRYACACGHTGSRVAFTSWGCWTLGWIYCERAALTTRTGDSRVTWSLRPGAGTALTACCFTPWLACVLCWHCCFWHTSGRASSCTRFPY